MRLGKILPGAGGYFLLTLLSYGVFAQVTPVPGYRPDSAAVIQPDTDKKIRVTTPVVKDTVKVGRLKHSPRKATLLSLALPGLGQAYNGRYWKVPIIYIGFGLIGYFFVDYNNYYQDFSNAYLRINANPSLGTIIIKNYGPLDKSKLQIGRDFYRRNRDFNIILFAGLWAINILEANIDAHLKGFDLSDDLSLRIKPDCSQDINSRPVPGLTLALMWK